MFIYVCEFTQNGQYRLNNDRKFVNVYTPEDHDEVLNEFLDDLNDVLPNVSESVISA